MLYREISNRVANEICRAEAQLIELSQIVKDSNDVNIESVFVLVLEDLARAIRLELSLFRRLVRLEPRLAQMPREIADLARAFSETLFEAQELAQLSRW